MRIAIVSAVFAPMINGVAVFARNLAFGLAEKGEKVLVVTPSDKGRHYEEEVGGAVLGTSDSSSPSGASGFSGGSVKIVRLESRELKLYPDQIHQAKKRGAFYEHGLPVSLNPVKEVAKALAEFRPEVIHIQVADPVGRAALKWAKKNNVPVVSTEHNQPEVLTSSIGLPRVLHGVANKGLYGYFRRQNGKSDFVTMPTKQAILNLIGEKGFSRPIAAVSNGVDLTHFQPGKAPAEIYEKYGISREGLKILYVGRVDPEKQVEKVLRAFKEARPKLPQTEVIVVGDGTDLARLRELVSGWEMRKEIKFLGRVLPPDLYELYKIGDVFATASEIETQGIVLIEAAAAGLPLAAVDGGAAGEVCRDGENGVLCGKKSGEKSGKVSGKVSGAKKQARDAEIVSEMAAGMEKILNDEKLREKFAKRSLGIAKEHDFGKTLEQFLNIYRKVIKINGK